MNIVVHAVLYLRSSVRGWSLAEVSRVVQEVIESKGMEDDRSADGEAGLVTVSGLYTQNPLQRSVSQLIDKKDEESWEPHFRRLDSGLVRTSLTSAFSSETWSSSSVMCLSVWRRGVCGLHQRLQHSQEGTHHVHRHQPLTFDPWPSSHVISTFSKHHLRTERSCFGEFRTALGLCGLVPGGNRIIQQTKELRVHTNMKPSTWNECWMKANKHCLTLA